MNKTYNMYMNGKNVIVTYEDGFLKAILPDTKTEEIISSKNVLKVSINKCSLTFEHVVRKTNGKMKIRSCTFYGKEENMVDLHEELSADMSGRPKKVLVIINPNSGKRKALRVYEEYAAPLFEAYNVHADVFVTHKSKEPTQILRSYDIFRLDGIVAVGGDGIFCEVINGLITRTQTDHNIDSNNFDTEIIPATIPIGIIPAGSGDILAQYLYGTRCPKTAVLNILLGHCVYSNLVGLYEGGRLLSYSALVLGFGLFGDMMYDCESFRWMGPARYNIIPLANMFKRRAINVEVEYITNENAVAISRSRLYGHHISFPNGFFDNEILSQIHKAKSTSDLPQPHHATEDSVTEIDSVYAVDSHAIMMKEEFGSGRMTPHFGQDSLMVYTTHKCSIPEHIRQLSKVKAEKPDCYDFKFVGRHSVSGYKVHITNATCKDSEGKTSLQEHYYINCDGEAILLSEPSFAVKFHKKVIKLFRHS